MPVGGDTDGNPGNRRAIFIKHHSAHPTAALVRYVRDRGLPGAEGEEVAARTAFRAR